MHEQVYVQDQIHRDYRPRIKAACEVYLVNCLVILRLEVTTLINTVDRHKHVCAS